MALPKLNNTPIYEMTVPSTGQTIKYRPFLVKEEKVLMIAAESGEQSTITNALIDTIKACVESELDTNTLTSFDVEYIFLQLRARSVGESTKIVLRCKECETKNTVTVNIDKIKIDIPNIEKRIDLGNNITVDLDWPVFNDILHFELNKSTSTETAFKVISKCITSINTPEERFAAKDTPENELIEFLESMNQEQFGRLKEFMDNIPKLSHKVGFSCTNCATSNEIDVEGLDNFLS